MRQHFKIAQGYLNVDEAAVIFTRSGNWTEAAHAPELDRTVRSKHTLRLSIGLALIALGDTFLAAKTLRAAWGTGSVLLIIGALGLGLYAMYDRLRDDLGGHYRIPFRKVIAMTYVDEHLDIRFLDGAMRERRMRTPMDPGAALFVLNAWQEQQDSRT